MPKALTITRDDFTAEELREAAARSTDADAARRMLGLALVLDGYQRGEAAKLCGMDRQILRDWVIRYNARALRDCPIASPPVPNRGFPPNRRRS